MYIFLDIQLPHCVDRTDQTKTSDRTSFSDLGLPDRPAPDTEVQGSNYFMGVILTLCTMWILGRNHGWIIRIPELFGLNLHENLKFHTPYPFSLRGRGRGLIFQGTHRLLRSDPIHFFGIFISRSPLPGNGGLVISFGKPQPFAAAPESDIGASHLSCLLSGNATGVIRMGQVVSGHPTV